ncbi:MULTISPECIES: bifunctional tetrahydrofolate synthase/dihydrofolate synthase [Gammaproteobacteria]|uniref:bifunctional tetrahydrofolate synthase/dihydrofolate synthase n=1 Tax=Gammaproteobacteria TaxID=1236 RepID=UPI000DCFE146|nr:MULTISPECIES: bifunctional tetrahydrofolate synthase/dihydrofolate synthase [Gammaproteobacteria]RTE86865.1 bifunctional tetrahydrofolate synthase/dihydrofolate synthase [Aliidiomarina sp. B3213]TCZ93346.1 bifunctional tetrahydrofolate synthase/dihydrofolate synthase [Lysobacter sp. N42]
MSILKHNEEPRSLETWLSYLEKIHSQVIDMGLERVSKVAATLDVLKPAPFVFLVAGTNGKGSTVAMLDAILTSAGYRTATYTSPHIVDYRERVKVNGEWLAESEHCEAFQDVEDAREDTTLTYFEFGTLAALHLIKKKVVDIAILEIGLGGRLDAVNIVEPDVSIVTSVGIDHVDFLGSDREVIGYEKAGVFRANCPAVCGDLNPPLKLIKHAQETDAHLFLAGTDYGIESQDNSNWAFYMTGMDETWVLPKPHLPLVNAATAVMALKQSGLKLTKESVIDGLQKAQVTGRFETLHNSPRVILDVGHNPHAANYLAQQLAKTGAKKVLAVCGMLKDKDIKGTLSVMESQVDHWYLGSLPSERGASSQQLAESLSTSAAFDVFSSITDAYNTALREAEDADVILCFGSFLTVSEIYKTEGKIIRG